METAHHILKTYFGYDAFRGLQQEIIEQVNNENDCLVLMPTGGGKSLCYQIPALMREGITLVISPLISLMKDQVDALRSNGIAAAFMNSSLSREQEEELMALCFNAQVKILYLSPERALAVLDNFLSLLPIKLIAIDEAHCVSQWGHDFRPEYKELHRLREKFPNCTMMALTATADKITRQDILQMLGLKNPKVFVASFDRPNISLAVKSGLQKKDKIREIYQLISKHENESGIVYCTSRDNTEMLAFELKNLGINAAHYHAGMPASERTTVQESFINDNIQVVCATIAFGMGIDKSNVRYVVHYNLPKSIESYYQEIGRGGRDGVACETILFYNLGDVMMLRKFAEESGQPQINLDKLKRMQEFADAQHCRRRILLSYFGEQQINNCGNCDICLNPPSLFNGTVVAQKALSAITRIQLANEHVGVNLLVDVLRGMRHKEIYERRLNEIKTYGAGSDLSFKQWMYYLMQLIQLGAIEIAYNENNILKVTTFGEMILKGKVELPLHEYTEQTTEKKKTKDKKQPQKLDYATNTDAGLFEKLRKLRKEIADELKFPPYIIFQDNTLHDMVAKKPRSKFEMLEVSGVSTTKFERYGQAFIEVIQAHQAE